jgi:hypothetical protein
MTRVGETVDAAKHRSYSAQARAASNQEIHHQDHTEPAADCASALRKLAVDW